MEGFLYILILNILLYGGIIAFGVYVAISIIKSMKQRNKYLEEIRDELRISNENKTNLDS